MKLCTSCGRVLPLECFSRRTDSRDGLQGRCRSCMRDYKLEWRNGRAEQRHATLAELTRTRAAAYRDDLRFYVVETSGYADSGGRNYVTEALVLDRVDAHRAVRSFRARSNRERAVALARAFAHSLNELELEELAT